MAKRKLSAITEDKPTKTALDLAEEVTSSPEPSRPISRTTDRISISLLTEERVALEDLSADLRHKGHRDLKTSRLARVAFKMLLGSSEEDILRVAEDVPNLERLRVRK